MTKADRIRALLADGLDTGSISYVVECSLAYVRCVRSRSRRGHALEPP